MELFLLFVLYLVIIGIVEAVILWSAPPVDRDETDDPAFNTDSLF